MSQTAVSQKSLQQPSKVGCSANMKTRCCKQNIWLRAQSYPTYSSESPEKNRDLDKASLFSMIAFVICGISTAVLASPFPLPFPPPTKDQQSQGAFRGTYNREQEANRFFALNALLPKALLRGQHLYLWYCSPAWAHQLYPTPSGNLSTDYMKWGISHRASHLFGI